MYRCIQMHMLCGIFCTCRQICVCTKILHTYTHIYCTHTYAHISMLKHTHINPYIYIQTHPEAENNVHTYASYTSIYSYICIHIHTHTYGQEWTFTRSCNAVVWLTVQVQIHGKCQYFSDFSCVRMFVSAVRFCILWAHFLCFSKQNCCPKSDFVLFTGLYASTCRFQRIVKCANPKP